MMSDKYFIDKERPGILRKVSDPTSGMLVGIDAPFVCEALNNYTQAIELLKIFVGDESMDMKLVHGHVEKAKELIRGWQ